MSIVALLSISVAGAMFFFYGGFRFAPENLIPYFGVCFFLFYTLIPISSVLGLATLFQQGILNRFAVLALTINAIAAVMWYTLFVLYD